MDNDFFKCALLILQFIFKILEYCNFDTVESFMLIKTDIIILNEWNIFFLNHKEIHSLSLCK